MPARHYDLHVASELKSKVSAMAPLVDFRLFGSRARGDADEFSDLDIFVEFEHVDGELKKRVKSAAWELTLKTGLVVTTLLFRRQEVEESPLRSPPIIRAIMEVGVPV